MVTCNTCKKSLSGQHGTVQFKCPQCTKYDIVRCVHCRILGSKFRCPDCGFEGPN